MRQSYQPGVRIKLARCARTNSLQQRSLCLFIFPSILFRWAGDEGVSSGRWECEQKSHVTSHSEDSRASMLPTLFPWCNYPVSHMMIKEHNKMEETWILELLNNKEPSTKLCWITFIINKIWRFWSLSLLWQLALLTLTSNIWEARRVENSFPKVLLSLNLTLVYPQVIVSSPLPNKSYIALNFHTNIREKAVRNGT